MPHERCLAYLKHRDLSGLVDLILKIGELRPMDQIYTEILKTFSLERLDVPMILVGLALFFCLYKLLEAKVFLPVLEHVERREHATSGAVDTASLMRQKTTALRERFEQKMFEARVEANSRKLEIVNRAKAEASELHKSAEQEVAKVLAAGRAKIASELSDCRRRVESESQALAELLSHKVDSELSVH